jgi:hypothetical protein
MSGGRRKRHNVRAPDFGPLGEPRLPIVGELFVVRSLLYGADDPAPARRAVVVGVPAAPSPAARIQIATRTSDTSMPGVPHPQDLALDCDLDGTFSERVSCLASSWRPGNVILLGVLPEPFLSHVLDRFA